MMSFKDWWAILRSNYGETWIIGLYVTFFFDQLNTEYQDPLGEGRPAWDKYDDWIIENRHLPEFKTWLFYK